MLYFPRLYFCEFSFPSLPVDDWEKFVEAIDGKVGQMGEIVGDGMCPNQYGYYAGIYEGLIDIFNI